MYTFTIIIVEINTRRRKLMIPEESDSCMSVLVVKGK